MFFSQAKKAELSNLSSIRRLEYWLGELERVCKRLDNADLRG